MKAVFFFKLESREFWTGKTSGYSVSGAIIRELFSAHVPISPAQVLAFRSRSSPTSTLVTWTCPYVTASAYAFSGAPYERERVI